MNYARRESSILGNVESTGGNMIIVFKSLDDFLKAVYHFPFVLQEPTRNELYMLYGNHVLLYRIRDKKELERAKKEKIVIPAIRLFTLNPEAATDYSQAIEELKKDAPKIIGKKVKDVKMGDDGIDLVLEDGTTLEIYCFGEWGWAIDKEDQDQEDDALL